jgi:ribosomal protein L11 methylase PrmA
MYTQSVIDSALSVPRALGSALAPKLLGCYEVELQEVLERALQTPYQEVIDIGSAEGYYAVGLALRLPLARVHAFEMDPLRQRLCAEMAQANGVAERVLIAGACDGEKLAALTSGHPLVVCDCEGYELELLQPDLISGLKHCDLLVELHDSANPIISSTIMARFAPTHDVTLIKSAEMDPATYPVLASLSAKDQQVAVNEERPAGMQWVFLQAKRAA